MPGHNENQFNYKFSAEYLSEINDGNTQNGDGTGNKLGVMTDAINTNIISMNNKVPSKGQKTMSGSVPVVLASNQSSITTTNANITKGADLSLSEAQQNLVYGVDAFDTSTLEPIRISSDKVMVESFIASVTSGITNSLPTKDMASWEAIATLSSSLSVPNSGNNDSSIISNNKLSDIYIVQVECDDNTYTDFNAEILESIDASNYKSTFQLQQGLTPSFFIFETLTRLAPNWKVRINNTGASTKTFTIKYVKAE